MTIPKWLLPVIAGFTAIAVGVASALVAFVLVGGTAAPAEPEAAPVVETEVVPLIAPVGYGDVAPPVDLDGDPETDDVSPYLGSATVPVSTASGEPPVLDEGSDGAIIGSDPGSIADLIDAETLAAIETLAAADDPAALPGIVTLFDGGDPCALADAPSESCPEGLRSRILSLTGLPPLFMFATTSPTIGDPADPDLLTCEPFELAEGEVRFAIGTNMPADVTVTYWPLGNRADARELFLPTPESQVALFEANPPRAGEPFTVLKHCLVLFGLQPDTRYQVSVVAETSAGERATRTHYVSLNVNLGRPPARIVPFGDNVVLASATHRYGETLLMRGGLLGDDDVANCANIDRLAALQFLAEPTTRRTSTEWLERNGYLNEFTELTSAAFFVPEGRNALICLSSYDDSRPSWNWEVADYISSAVVQAPDVTIPTVTWIGASLRESAGIQQVNVALTPRGAPECGYRALTVPIAPDRFSLEPSGGIVLCENLALDGYNFVNTGNFIVRASARLAGGFKDASAGLPLGRDRCVGLCETLPPTSYYSIALPLVEVASGLCGSSFGVCEPPTSAVSGGTIQLRVDWEHGARNGAEEWSMSPIIEAAGVPWLVEEPQFDTTARPRYVSDSSGARLEFDLRSDRPVNYRATLLGDCMLPETVTVVEGRWQNLLDSRVAFANPCRGATYNILVELVDDEGRSVAYGPHTSGTIWWSAIDIPGTVANVNVSYRLTLLDDDGRATSLVEPIAVTVGTTQMFRAYWLRNRCVFGEIATDLAATGRIPFPDVVPITATFTVRDGLGLSEDDDADGFADCYLHAPGGDTITVESSVLLSELRSTGSYSFTTENDDLRLLMYVTLID